MTSTSTDTAGSPGLIRLEDADGTGHWYCRGCVPVAIGAGTGFPARTPWPERRPDDRCATCRITRADAQREAEGAAAAELAGHQPFDRNWRARRERMRQALPLHRRK